MERLVDDFYGRITKDDTLGPFFSSTDMEKQKRHQTRFLSYAFGEDGEYGGRAMDKAHEQLKAGHGHFDSFLGHLSDALAEAKLPQEDIRQAMERVSAFRNHIVKE
jgi:hemoglobin